MPEQVSQAVKEERNQRLLEVVNEAGRAAAPEVRGPPGADSGRGAEQEESRADDGPDALQQDRRVRRVAEGHRGQLLDVTIQRAGTFTLYGAADEGR